MTEVYINLKDLGDYSYEYIKDCFKNKDLVSVEELLDALNETLEDLDKTKEELEEIKKTKNEEFDEMIRRLNWR